MTYKYGHILQSDQDLSARPYKSELWPVSHTSNHYSTVLHSVCFVIFQAPSDPPTIVKSYASSSTSVFLDWQPPSPDAINGALLRYEVVFWEPSQMALGSAGSAMNVESADPGPGVATSFTVQGLEKYVNYHYAMY